VSEPIVVEVRRSGVVEAAHRVHAVAVRSGEVVAAAGDPSLTCFMRSSSKPLQALPLVRARDDLPDDELAIACASHRDTPEQVAAVRALLARAEATEDDLELGLQEDRPPQKIHHNCSGKHAGMLALCRAEGWPTEGYRLPDHPVQRGCLAAHVEATEVEPLATAIDGCGVVTFALPLERMAYALSRLTKLVGGERIVSAMRAYPQLIGGEGSLDTQLMKAHQGWLAKGGAEGLLCGITPDGAGFALKTEDGASRALGPALASFFPGLDDFARVPVENSRGEEVGEVVAG
jgi:L-asparaginase II